MTILGIETSCDETSVAIIEGKKDYVEIKSNIIASSLAEHAQTGGIIPEVAARAQLKFILPVLTEALEKAFGLSAENISSTPPPIDAIAVTYGPGLIGPLLIGVETARTLSYIWNKPVIPVNHMLGHIYANFIYNDQMENGKLKMENNTPIFPLIALVVSGGHTDLIYMKKHGDYHVLGGTRDDAAGEAFDKIGRLLGLPYPAGPIIEERSKLGNPKRFHFPRPLMNPPSYEFSFSGLKTAVLREVLKYRESLPQPKIDEASRLPLPLGDKISKLPLPLGEGRGEGKCLDDQTINDIAAGTQTAIVDVLVKKTLRAVKETTVKSLLLSGGVAANQMLRNQFSVLSSKFKVKFFAPAKNLCTDNAAMIASAAYFNSHPLDWRALTPDPELYYE